MDSSIVIEHLRTENLVSGQSGLFSLAGMETMAENVFFVNGIDLGKCVEKFTKIWKLACLKYFWRRKKWYNSFDLMYHRSKDMASWIGVLTTLHLLTLVKSYKFNLESHLKTDEMDSS